MGIRVLITGGTGFIGSHLADELLAHDHSVRHACNIGGAPLHSSSLLELVRLIGALDGSEPTVTFDERRVGDRHGFLKAVVVP